MKQNKYPPSLYRIFTGQKRGMKEWGSCPPHPQEKKKGKSLGLFYIVLYRQNGEERERESRV
jgi:hypothetical protein